MSALTIHKVNPGNLQKIKCKAMLLMLEAQLGLVTRLLFYIFNQVILTEKLISELCVDEWKDWRKCIRGKRGEWFGTWNCKPKYLIFEQCQMRYLQDLEQLKKFEEEYLSLRTEYRKTGVGRAFMTKERIRELCEL
ncbi:hypothetical protein Smp_003250 [Schistosoma mansoni]|uniref:hypothetical protein n=1 Tax=Schistosoma mansoni TaxID=6183 RepID=UPI0001A63F78|nr:hypothetical protein Smp_003250 [Schistosoma mansoni]|eukprot:XP_018647697.1 hypothetical protein Smp_003250 [Schistosoma mansoni]